MLERSRLTSQLLLKRLHLIVNHLLLACIQIARRGIKTLLAISYDSYVMMMVVGATFLYASYQKSKLELNTHYQEGFQRGYSAGRIVIDDSFTIEPDYDYDILSDVVRRVKVYDDETRFVCSGSGTTVTDRTYTWTYTDCAASSDTFTHGIDLNGDLIQVKSMIARSSLDRDSLVLLLDENKLGSAYHNGERDEDGTSYLWITREGTVTWHDGIYLSSDIHTDSTTLLSSAPIYDSPDDYIYLTEHKNDALYFSSSVDDAIRDEAVIHLASHSEAHEALGSSSGLYFVVSDGKNRKTSASERESRLFPFIANVWLRWIGGLIIIIITHCLLFHFHFRPKPPEYEQAFISSLSMHIIVEARGQVVLAQLDKALANIETNLEASNARLRKEINILQYQYNDLKRQERAGIINPTEAGILRNKIAYATLDLLAMLERSSDRGAGQQPQFA